MISIYKVGDFIVIKSGELEKQFQIIECATNYIRIIDTFTQIESKRKIVELDDLIVSGVATIKQQDTSERKVHQVDAIDFSSYPEPKKLKAREKHVFVIGIIDHGLPSTSEERIDPVIDEIYAKGIFETFKKRPSARSVQRWIKSYKKANNSIRGLIPLDSQKGNYEPKVENDVESYIELAIEHFKKFEKPTVSSSYDHLETLIENDNSFIKEFSKKRKVPSLTAFIKRLEKKAPKEMMLAREGKETNNKAFKETKLPQEITLILQRVEADHTQLDLFIVDEKSSLILGRPYITSILDYKSKCLLGFYIGFENPSYLSIARALRHVILPKTYVKEMYPEIVNEWQCYGVPKILVVDRGMDFESIALTDACLDLNIRIQRNPGKHPWYKGSIERFFRSVNDDLLSDKKGKVFPNIVDTNAYKPEKHAVITMGLFLKMFHKWVIDIYHMKKVSKGQIIPSVSWAEDLDRVPRRIMNQDALNIVLSERKSLKNSKDGIKFEHIFYDNKELVNLRAMHGMEKTDFKYDRENLGQIQVFNRYENKYFKVPAVDQKYAQGMSLHQHQIIKNFHNKFIQGNIDAEALAVAKTQIMKMIKDHIDSRKDQSIASSSAVARVLDIGQQSDQSVKGSVHDEINKQVNKNDTENHEDDSAQNTPVKSDKKDLKLFDGKENKMRNKLEY